MRRGCTSGSRGGRAQSEVLGVLLLLGLAVAGTTAIVVFGGTALNDAGDAAQRQRLQQSMTRFDAEASRVALGGSEREEVRLGDVEERGSVVDDGRLRVEIVDRTTGDVEAVVADRRLGAVVYGAGDSTVAYQGGGVWLRRGDDSRMVSPPEFRYRDATLTLPVVAVEGEDSLGGEVVVERGGGSERASPGGDLLDEGTVRITVESAYYEAWGEFLERRTGGEVRYDHDAGTVTVGMVATVDRTTLAGAVSATSPGGRLHIAGTGGPGGGTYTDSYDSSAGAYDPSTAGSNGDVIYGGDVEVTGNARVGGDVRSGGDVDTGGSAAVDGDLRYGGTACDDAGATAGHGCVPAGGVDAVAPMTPEVAETVRAVEADNDNGDHPSVVTGGEADFSGSATLDAGRYYFEALDVDGRTLELDNTDGPVTVAVRDHVRVGDGTIRVTDPDGAAVEMYVLGENGTTDGCAYGECHLTVGPRGAVTVPGDRAPALRVYGTGDFRATVRGAGGPNAARFVGVVYAPAGADGDGAITVGHAEVYGGLVTGDVTLGNGASVHFDEALADEAVVPPGAKVDRLDRLQVTVDEIAVSDG